MKLRNLGVWKCNYYGAQCDRRHVEHNYVKEIKRLITYRINLIIIIYDSITTVLL